MPSRSAIVELAIRKPRAELPKFIAVPPTFTAPAATTRPVEEVDRAPFSSLGLLVDGQSGTATTAWLVSPDTIVTAGHCLCRPEHRPRTRSFHFALQYSRLQGGWWSRVVAAATLWGWDMHSDHHYDLAVCKLDRSFPDPVLKISTQAPTGECLVLGYAFGGAQLWQAHSQDLRWNARGAQISAHMSEGCSGGPWLTRRGRNTRVVGITSRGGEGFLVSPAWGKGVLNLLDWAEKV
jgi:V8-like Glu-specific endopeptidase